MSKIPNEYDKKLTQIKNQVNQEILIVIKTFMSLFRK